MNDLIKLEDYVVIYHNNLPGMTKDENSWNMYLKLLNMYENKKNIKIALHIFNSLKASGFLIKKEHMKNEY